MVSDPRYHRLVPATQSALLALPSVFQIVSSVPGWGDWACSLPDFVYVDR